MMNAKESTHSTDHHRRVYPCYWEMVNPAAVSGWGVDALWCQYLTEVSARALILSTSFRAPTNRPTLRSVME